MDNANDHLSIYITEPEEPMDDILIKPEKPMDDDLTIHITEPTDDKVSIDIMKKLDLVKLVSEKPSDPCIGRVRKHLRDVNPEAYEPQIVAIGPYHCRNKPHLQDMETHKLLYLKILLQQGGEDHVKRYVKTMTELEGRARACYNDAVCLEESRFVEMLLLDACFIVELFRKYHRKVKKKNPVTNYYDPVIDSCWMDGMLCRDLLLVENQIPFFVLDNFFQKTATQDEPNNFLEIIFTFFDYLLPYDRCDKQDADHSNKEIKHLLSLVHDHWFRRVVPESPSSGTRKWKILKILKAPCLLRKVGEGDWDGVPIRCATELKEAGINLREAKGKALFDIEFENGTMKIPKLKVEDDTESLFRNLTVYEQLYPEESNPVVDYIKFMDRLINSAKDVELLGQHKIVDILLGDDEVVAKMFNRLCDSVVFSSSDRYKNIHQNVNKHCGRRCNKWMANLRHNYFNTPWAFISFLAAVLLLLLTFTQTLFSAPRSY